MNANKNVVFSIVRLDESVTLAKAEPFYGPALHVSLCENRLFDAQNSDDAKMFPEPAERDGRMRKPVAETLSLGAKTTSRKAPNGSKEGKGASPSQLIDARIKELNDWRGETLARVRILIKQADPEVVEEWKWRGVPVWSHDGIICTGETYKNVVKMTFAKGASLEDRSGLFNSSLEGNTRRAVDFHEGETIDEEALKALIRAAAALNRSAAARVRPVRSQKRPRSDQ
jgi:hypothetical protein